MSYLTQLKERIGNTNPQTGTDKTAKSPSVSSVSTVPMVVVGNSGASGATTSPQVELMALIKAVGTHFAFTSEESVEATQIAFADPEGALASYRDVANRYGLSVPTARQTRLP